MPGEQKPKVKKLNKAVILHCGYFLNEVVKPLKTALDEQLHLERVSYYRNTSSIDKLVKDSESIVGDGSVRGICVVTQKLLQLLSNCPKEDFHKFSDWLLHEISGYPVFVCLLYKVTEDEVKEVIPNISAKLTFEVGTVNELCDHIYKQWFGSKSYVDEQGYHCVREDEAKQINCVHIIHAGEDKRFLNDLSDALEDVLNPECSCEYRRFYRDEHTIADKIVSDVNQFVDSCQDNNKCLVIVSDRLIDVLKKSPEQKDAIKKQIYRNFKAKIPNFVLLEMTKNDIFLRSSFWQITVEYDEQQLEVVADLALNIWQKRLKLPEESIDSFDDTRQQSTPSTDDAGKLLPSDYVSLGKSAARTPCDGQLVCDPRSIVESAESVQHQYPDPHVNSKVTKCLPSGQGKDKFCPEINYLNAQMQIHAPREHIPSDNPDDLRSNPPPNDFQPVDPDAVKGKLALNPAQDSVSLKHAFQRGRNLSYQKDARNKNHDNENVVSKHVDKTSIQFCVPGAERRPSDDQIRSLLSHGRHGATAPAHSSMLSIDVGITTSSDSELIEPKQPTSSTGRPARSLGSQGQPGAFAPAPIGGSCITEGNEGNTDIPASFYYQSSEAAPSTITPLETPDKEEDDEDRMNSVSSQDIPANNFDSMPHRRETATTPKSGPSSLPARIAPVTDNQSVKSFENSTVSNNSRHEVPTEDTRLLVRGLDFSCLDKIKKRLDLPIPCVHDWRNLAGHYGVPNADIHVWSSKMPYISASNSLFDWLTIVQPELTIETLKEDLKNFRRRDTLKILQEYGY